MTDCILVLNAGSSSLKFSVFEDTESGLQLFISGLFEGLFTHPRFKAKKAGIVVEEKTWDKGTQLPHDEAIAFLFQLENRGILEGREIRAAGHRVVHGGQEFTHPVLLNPDIFKKLEKYIDLAPLHQPHNLSAIRAVFHRAPKLPQAACFDTAFHCTQPGVAQMFAIPREYTEKGIRRYGFHGLSYEYIASVLPRFDPKAAAGKTLVAHLGNGASMCAMKNSQSIASTMGFTAAEGIPMGTRCGSIDPGVLIYLMDHYGMNSRALEDFIYKKCGLLGVSGISSDMRELLASSDPHAAEAVDLFVYRIARETGSLAAAVQGVEAVVFTGGIGENSAVIRSRVCRLCEWLGVSLDESANEKGGPKISTEGSRVSAWTIPTNEELMIARHTRKLLGKS